jgi:3'-phosphoadenosine 5'-phosphosulfate sulfotransferase
MRFEDLVELFESIVARFRLIKHPPEGRCDFVAQDRGTAPYQRAKEMLCRGKGPNGPLTLMILPGDAALSLDELSSVYCFVHAKRKFDELVKANASVVASQAIQCISGLYKVEADARPLTTAQRLQMRNLQRQ